MGLFGEESEEFTASQFAPKHGVPGCINAVNLEDGLGEIETNRDNGPKHGVIGRINAVNLENRVPTAVERVSRFSPLLDPWFSYRAEDVRGA